MYSEKLINEANLIDFIDYIPINYHEQIFLGELKALAVYEKNGEEVEFLGVTVTADHAGFMEIVWAAVNKDLFTVSRAADLLRYRIAKAKLSGKYKGAFAEIHADEKTRIHENILLMSGFSLTETLNNNHEFTLKDVKATGLIEQAAGRANIISVSESSQEIRYEIEEAMSDDERPIPAPYEVDWDECEQDLSMICLENESPVGLLLFTREEDFLVLELAYTKSQLALPALLGAAYLKAKEKYPPEQKFLVPIVGKGTGDIVERIVPEAKRGRIIEAVRWFDKPYMTPVMEKLLER